MKISGWVPERSATLLQRFAIVCLLWLESNLFPHIYSRRIYSEIGEALIQIKKLVLAFNDLQAGISHASEAGDSFGGSRAYAEPPSRR